MNLRVSLKNLTSLRDLVEVKQTRREKLFRIIGPKIEDWTTYADIVDIVKQEAPDMYIFGEGAARYVSSRLMEDLKVLFFNFGYITEYEHHRVDGFCHTAYRVTDLGKSVLKRAQT